MDNQPTIIDIEYAAKLMGGNRALVKEVLIDFINKIPNYLNELNQYVKLD